MTVVLQIHFYALLLNNLVRIFLTQHVYIDKMNAMFYFSFSFLTNKQIFRKSFFITHAVRANIPTHCHTNTSACKYLNLNDRKKNTMRTEKIDWDRKKREREKARNNVVHMCVCLP